MVEDFKKIREELKSLKNKDSKKGNSKISKFLSKKISDKKVIKKNQATMVIPNYKAESNFGSSSSFFKQEMEDTKGIFFS